MTGRHALGIVSAMTRFPVCSASALSAALLTLGLASAGLVSACAPQPVAPPVAPVPPYTTTATVKDLMLYLVDPAADQVWEAVMTVHSAAGTVETVPRSEEDWAAARHGAMVLLETSNLLMVPGRHVGRDGDKSEAPGVELEPAEMEANILKDLPEYYKAAVGLHDAAVLALQAIDTKNAEKLFEVGETIEMACEHCHSRYWYPNEKIPAIVPAPPATAPARP
jgi:hypothetical protein